MKRKKELGEGQLSRLGSVGGPAGMGIWEGVSPVSLVISYFLRDKQLWGMGMYQACLSGLVEAVRKEDGAR